MHAYSVSRGQRAARDSRHARLHARSIVTLVHAVPRVAGAGPVPAQMWQGRAQSRRRCGRGGPSPGADVVPSLTCRAPAVVNLIAATPLEEFKVEWHKWQVWVRPIPPMGLRWMRPQRSRRSVARATRRRVAPPTTRGAAWRAARHATRRVSWHATRHVARQCNAARCVAAAGAVRLDAARPRGPRGLDAKHP